MKNPDAPLPPPMLLAIAYAPAPVRARLAWLLTFDQRLSDVLTRGSESMIAQLRLSWWRDALNSNPDKRPKGEPLLALLNVIEPDDLVTTAGLKLVDAYEILATASDSLEQDNAKRQRILAITKSYRLWRGYADSEDHQIDKIIQYWMNPAEPLPKSLPRILRPLTILALAEHLESSQSRTSPLRLNWHALTGR